MVFSLAVFEDISSIFTGTLTFAFDTQAVPVQSRRSIHVQFYCKYKNRQEN